MYWNWIYTTLVCCIGNDSNSEFFVPGELVVENEA